MEVRNNVRQRRRERIQQLTARRAEEGWMGAPSHGSEGAEADGAGMPADAGAPYELWAPEGAEDFRAPSLAEEPPAADAQLSPSEPDPGLFGGAYEEPDPERWWKERERRQRGRPGGGAASGADPLRGAAEPDVARRAGQRGASGAPRPGSAGFEPSYFAPGASDTSRPGAAGAGTTQRFTFGQPPGSSPPAGAAGPGGGGPIGSIANLSPYRGLAGRTNWDETPPTDEESGALRRFMRGLAARVGWSAALLGAIWAWMHWELPGSEAVAGWTYRSVTEDMDFAAVEAWYANTFGGSPSFLPIFKNEAPSEAVSAQWSHADAVAPLAGGRVVQPFASGGSGVRLAAPAGTAVQAVHAGRVTKVTTVAQGLTTIEVQHENGLVTVYSDVAKPAAKAGDWVETGRTLGELPAGDGARSGGSGDSAASAGGRSGEGTLFFAVRQNGKALDPAEVVPLD